MKTLLITLMVSTMLFPFQNSNKRKVLLFSTGKNAAVLLQQQKMLNSDPKGIQERDIVIETHVTNGQNKSLFKKYNVQDASFLFILIGKDGGEKLRSPTVVTNQQLFGLIDQMPMRQDEMRKQR